MDPQKAKILITFKTPKNEPKISLSLCNSHTHREYRTVRALEDDDVFYILLVVVVVVNFFICDRWEMEWKKK